MLYKVNGITVSNLILESVPSSLLKSIVDDIKSDKESLYLFRKQIENILDITKNITKNYSGEGVVELRKLAARARKNNNQEEVNRIESELKKFPVKVSNRQKSIDNNIVDLNCVSIGILEHFLQPSIQAKLKALLTSCIYEGKTDKSEMFFGRDLYVLNQTPYHKIIFMIHLRIMSIDGSTTKKENFIEELNRFVKMVEDNTIDEKDKYSIEENKVHSSERLHSIFSKKDRLSVALVPSVYDNLEESLNCKDFDIEDYRSEILELCIKSMYELQKLGLYGFNIANKEFIERYNKTKRSIFSSKLEIPREGDLYRVKLLIEDILVNRSYKEGDLLDKTVVDNPVNIDYVIEDLDDSIITDLGDSDYSITDDDFIEEFDEPITIFSNSDEEVEEINNNLEQRNKLINIGSDELSNMDIEFIESELNKAIQSETYEIKIEDELEEL